INAQFPILIRGSTNCYMWGHVGKDCTLGSIRRGLIEFAAKIIGIAGKLFKTFQGRHVAKQILRSGTAAAPNYAEARGSESRADFVHKMRIVQKELNETSVWLRVITRCSLLSPESIVAILAENKELSRIVTASIRTARRRISAAPSN